MDLLLNAGQRLLWESAARLCADAGGDARSRALQAAGQDHDREAWRLMTASGWIGVLLADAADGSASGAVALGLVQHAIGLHDVRVPLAAAAIAAQALTDGGAVAAGALEAIVAGTQIVVPAVLGAGTAFAPRGALPRADRAADGWVLHGAHSAVPDAALADRLLIAATGGGGPILCLIRPDAAGVTLRTRAMIDGSQVSDIVLTGTRVAAADVVAAGAAASARTAAITALQSLAVSFALLGVGDAALALTLEHLKLRQQFGRPIGSFQALQHRAVDGFVALELVRSLALRVAAAFDAGGAHPAMIPALKAKAGRDVLAVVRRGLQIHGALGYAAEHPIGRRYQRALVLSACFGNEADHLAQFAALAGGAAA